MFAYKGEDGHFFFKQGYHFRVRSLLKSYSAAMLNKKRKITD